jgi:hypothetical protein
MNDTIEWHNKIPPVKDDTDISRNTDISEISGIESHTAGENTLFGQDSEPVYRAFVAMGQRNIRSPPSAVLVSAGPRDYSYDLAGSDNCNRNASRVWPRGDWQPASYMR